MNIENVDWQIISKCNRSCPYCYGPLSIDELSIDKIYKIIDKLVYNGVKQLGITGGEPLIHPYISEIINYSFDSGLKIYLSTNCDYYSKYSELIKEKVSIIGIPIDGSNAKTHDLNRGTQNFKSVLNAANDIYNSKCTTKIKFGTVVTVDNCNELLKIEKIISKYNSKIIFWKLYELISYERNKSKVAPIKCSMQLYTSKLGQYIDINKIIFDTIDKRDKSYFFLKPNGDVFIPQLSKNISQERIIGNILYDNFESIALKFNELVDICGYFKNYRYMKGE